MTKKPIHRERLKKMKERLGGASEELKAMHKYNTQLIKAVRQAIKDGHETVPAIHDALEHKYPTHEIFWAVVALNRWDREIQLVDKSDEYPVYKYLG